MPEIAPEGGSRGRDELEGVVKGSGAAGWSEAEAAVFRGVEELLTRQPISDETWAALARPGTRRS